MIRKTLLTAIAFAALAVVPAAASAAAPLSLQGEELATAPGPGTAFLVPCSPSGASFTVSGPAVGPYVGTFTETGTIKFDQSTGAFSFNASFTITADDGTVITGTKSDLDPAVNYRPPTCFNGFGAFVGFDTEVGYSATIKTSSGSYHDEGTSEVADIGGGGGFDEFFDTSTAGTPTPLAPTTASECKQGGWKTYGTFKNQGDCVSSVATGGRNAGNGS